MILLMIVNVCMMFGWFDDQEKSFKDLGWQKDVALEFRDSFLEKPHSMAGGNGNYSTVYSDSSVLKGRWHATI